MLYQLPLKVLQLEPAAHCGALGEEKHGDGVLPAVVGSQVGVVAVNGPDGIKDSVQ